MKLSDFAEEKGVTYKTAWNWYKKGYIKGTQLPNGTILVEVETTHLPVEEKVVVYARVSSAEMKGNLETQAERLVSYCAAKGYQIAQVVKEVGSGVNDSRPKFQKLLADTSITRIIVEHKDRATRFGFAYLETLLHGQDRSIEVVNLAENGKEDLMTDLVSIIYSFSARLYGQRRAKRKTEVIIKELAESEDQDAISGATSD